jgi:hypothetical protein
MWLEWERAGIRSRLPLDRPLVIGRDPSSDVRLVDPTVSRRHAIVSIVAGQAVVDASGSTNGIQLARGRADKVALSPGQPFRIGDTEFRVALGGAGAQPAAAQPAAVFHPANRQPIGQPPYPGSMPPSFGAVAPAVAPSRGALIAAIALGLVAILVVGSIMALAIMNSSGGKSPTPGKSAGSSSGGWSVSSGAIPSDAPAGLTSAIESFEPPAPVFGSGFVVDSVREDGDWAVAFGHAVAGPSDSNTPTETIVVIAQRTGSGWTTVSNRDEGFCAALDQLPEGLMDATERSYYGCS